MAQINKWGNTTRVIIRNSNENIIGGGQIFENIVLHHTGSISPMCSHINGSLTVEIKPMAIVNGDLDYEKDGTPIKYMSVQKHEEKVVLMFFGFLVVQLIVWFLIKK